MLLENHDLGERFRNVVHIATNIYVCNMFFNEFDCILQFQKYVHFV